MKTAKILSLVVVVVAAAGLLAITGWMVHAQDELLPTEEVGQSATTYDLTAMSDDQLYEEGKRLKLEERYAEALPLLEEKLRRDPTNEPTAILAGVCLEKQGRVEEALEQYLKATGEKSGYRSTGLYCAAVCYKELGDNAKALELLKIQKESSPIDKWTMKGVALKGEIEGLSPAQIEQLVAYELEAADLYRQARDLARETRYKSPDPLPLFDRVIDGYPDTGGAFSAMSQKAELLWHLGKREDMCKVYEKLRAVLKQQPSSEKVRLAFRTMDCRIGQHRAEQLLTQITRELAAGRQVEDRYWDQLDVQWDRWRHNADGHVAAEADLFLITMRFFQGGYAETIEVADAFFREHYETDRNRVLDRDYKGVFSSAHMYTGQALKKLQRYSEALDHFRWVVETAAATPPLRQEQTVVPEAYAQICWTLVKMGAPREEVQQEVDACLAQYPANSFTSALMQLRDSQ